MKRCLTILLCALLLWGALPLSAAAESGTVTLKGPASCVPGEQIAVSVDVSGLKNCCGLSLRMEYDSSVLTAESARLGNAFAGAQLNIRESGVIRFSYAEVDPASFSGTVFTVSFRVKSAASCGSATVRVAEASACDANQNALSLSLPAAAVISICEAQPLSLVLLSETEADGSVAVRVLLAEGTYYCALSFRLRYENCTLVSCSNYDSSAFGGSTGFINPTYSQNQISFNSASADPHNQGGELLQARFRPCGAEAPAFDIDPLKAYGTDNTALVAEWSRQADLVISSECKDEQLQITCAATAQTAVVIAAVYQSSGRMSDCAVSGPASAPCAARTVDLSLPEPESGAAVKVFFLDADCIPCRAAARISVEQTAGVRTSAEQTGPQ